MPFLFRSGRTPWPDVCPTRLSRSRRLHGSTRVRPWWSVHCDETVEARGCSFVHIAASRSEHSTDGSQGASIRAAFAVQAGNADDALDCDMPQKAARWCCVVANGSFGCWICNTDGHVLPVQNRGFLRFSRRPHRCDNEASVPSLGNPLRSFRGGFATCDSARRWHPNRRITCL
jgi:hypothetical protein